MITDLHALLDGWEYEPGKISVRKIIGRDGREKIQTRVDLGLLQCEADGRPDGQRPQGCESLLEYYRKRLRDHTARCGSDEGFSIPTEGCRDLRNEANLYYQRYLALFVLGEFEKVIRDTQRNLDVTDLCGNYGETEEDRRTLESQRAYVRMMNIRACAYLALGKSDYESALRIIDEGIDEIRMLAVEESDCPYGEEEVPELVVLRKFREDIFGRMPSDAPSKIRWELEQAVAAEQYEKAAELRDRLASVGAAARD